MIDFRQKSFCGPGLALAAALLFSFGGVIVKLLPWHALSINSARSLVAFIITVIYIKIIGHKIKFNRWVLLSGVCLMLTITLYCVSNRLTTAANTILLQYTSPLFIIILSYAAFKIKPKKLDLAMCFSVFIGVIFFLFDSLSTGNILGDALALISGCTYAVVFMTNILPKGDALSAFFVGQLMSFVVGFPFLLQETDFSPNVVGGGIAMGIILGGGYVLLAIALKHVRPVTANLLGTVEPIFNPVWVAIFYGEMITIFAAVGFVIVVASVVTYNILCAKKYGY